MPRAQTTARSPRTRHATHWPLLVLALLSCAGSALSQSGLPSHPETRTAQPYLPPDSTLPSSTQPEKIATLEDYIRALVYFSNSRTSMAMAFPKKSSIHTWVQMASTDATLLKSPTVRLQTISLLGDIRNLEALHKRAAEQHHQIMSKSAGKSVTYSSSGNNSRRPPKNPMADQMEAQGKLQQDTYKQEATIKDNIKKRVEVLQSLSASPEGKNFAMPKSSRLFQALMSPDASPSTGTTPVPAASTTYLRTEVISQNQDGILAYRKKIVSSPNGPTPRGADGEYLFEADRSKTILITGFPDTVSMGDSLNFHASYGGEKTINGSPCTEYIFVKKR